MAVSSTVSTKDWADSSDGVRVTVVEIVVTVSVVVGVAGVPVTVTFTESTRVWADASDGARVTVSSTVSSYNVIVLTPPGCYLDAVNLIVSCS